MKHKKAISFSSVAFAIVLMCTTLFAFSVTANAAVIYGDVNEDGEITIADATVIQTYIAELETFTYSQILAADVDNDGDVTIQDANYIQRYCAGLIEDFPINVPETTAPPVTTAPTAPTQPVTDDEGWNVDVVKP